MSLIAVYKFLYNYYSLFLMHIYYINNHSKVNNFLYYLKLVNFIAFDEKNGV